MEIYIIFWKVIDKNVIINIFNFIYVDVLKVEVDERERENVGDYIFINYFLGYNMNFYLL